MASNNLPQCANKAAPLGMSFSNFTTHGVLARGFGIWVGSPLQLLAMRASTADDYIWTYNAADCVPGQEAYCAGNWGGYYNSSQSRTYTAATKSTWNGTGVTELTTVPSDSYIYFNDGIQFGKNGSSPEFPLLTRKVGYNVGNGLGLGAGSTFLDQAVKSGSAPSKAFGLWVGSRSQTQPVDGALYIGGYDTSRVNGNFTQFSGFDQCETCVIVTDISYQTPSGQTTRLFSNSTETLTINLQPYVFGMSIPQDVWTNFVRVTNTSGILKNLNGKAGFSTDYSQLGNLSVTLSNGYKTIIPNNELFTYPTSVDTTTGVLGIANNTYTITQLTNTNYTGYVFDWGMAYLSQNYMIVDYDNNKFQLAPARQGPYYQTNGALVQPLCSGIAAATVSAVVTPSASGNGTGAASGSGSSSSGTNVGAIAGGVVGGVVGLLLIAALAWWILRNKRKQKALKAERDAAIASTAGRDSQAGPHYGGETGMVQQQRASQFTTPGSPTAVSEIYGGEKAHDSPQRDNINQWLYSTQKTPTESSFNPGSDTQTHTSATVHGPVEMPAYQYR